MKFRYFGYLLFLAVFIFFGYFISKNISVILYTFNTTLTHLTSYVLIAAALSAFSYILIGFSYRSIFKIVGIKRGVIESLWLMISSITLNVLFPSGGLASIAVFAEDADEHGDSKPAEVSGGVLCLMADYTAISIILLASNLYLFSTDSLHWASFVPSIVFWVLTLLLYVLFWLSTKKRSFITVKITALFLWLARLIKRISKKKIKAEEFAEKFISEFANANKSISNDKSDWYKSIGIFLFSHIARIAVLYLIFSSFGVEILWRNILVGYAIGVTILVLSPTPMGIGFVEGAMGLAYVNLGLSGSVATATVLIYRALVFWVPFFVGFLFLQSKRLKKIREEIRSIESGS